MLTILGATFVVLLAFTIGRYYEVLVISKKLGQLIDNLIETSLDRVDETDGIAVNMDVFSKKTTEFVNSAANTLTKGSKDDK